MTGLSPLRSGRNFCRDTSGNVALIFAIVALPLFAAMGLAVDYSFAARERTDLQNAIDAAAISLARLPQNTSEEVLKTKAEAFVAAQMPNARATGIDIEVEKGKGTLTINATALYPTLIVKVLDLVTGDNQHDNMNIGTSSTAQWGSGKVEVVLVLDNTGSMKGDKITNLKSAANALVDTLAQQVTDAGTVKIALVPFSDTVRLPTSYQTAAWMDKDGKSAIAADIFNGTKDIKRFDLFAKLDKTVNPSKTDVTWAGCVENRGAPYDVTDPKPTTSTPGTLVLPYFWPDEPDSTHEVGKKKTPMADYRNNYLADGVAANKTWKEKQGATAKYNSTSPGKTITGSDPEYGPNRGCGLQAVVPLTTDFSATGPIKKGITAMKPVGFTNIPMGLAWGWYAISPNDMLTDNAPYDDEETAKVIVLMTDGDNTIGRAESLFTTDVDEWDDDDDVTYNKNGSPYSGIGYIWNNRVGVSSTTASSSKRTGALDDRLELLCTNIKAVKKKAGSDKPAIEIYTVLVELDSDATSDLLEDCASTDSMFYNVANSANLTSVFNNIAGSIGKLHLAQ